MSKQIPDSSMAVWAIPAADGLSVIEVCRHGDKYVVVTVAQDGTRYQRSQRGMALERAKRDAAWVAGQQVMHAAFAALAKAGL